MRVVHRMRSSSPLDCTRRPLGRSAWSKGLHKLPRPCCSRAQQHTAGNPPTTIVKWLPKSEASLVTDNHGVASVGVSNTAVNRSVCACAANVQSLSRTVQALQHALTAENLANRENKILCQTTAHTLKKELR